MKVPPVPETGAPASEKLILLDPPSSVPAVRVHVPLKVWLNPAPRFRVPAVPFKVSPTPFTDPVRVATPEAFVIDTRPVVVNPPIL